MTITAIIISFFYQIFLKQDLFKKMSEFDAFESTPASDAADPAADFLAKEEAELAKIENNDFEQVSASDAKPSDPFEAFGKIFFL